MRGCGPRTTQSRETSFDAQEESVTGLTIVSLSGGMDSATCLGLAVSEGGEVHAVSFLYGQRHRRELLSAREVATYYGVRHDVVDLGSLGRLLTGSALTDESLPVPLGHYTDETMRQTVVPNRNAIMWSALWGVAVARGATQIYVGPHNGDAAIYPDCRPAFVNSLNATLTLATDTFAKPGLAIVAPFIELTKGGIVRRGVELRVPYEMTYSCYQGRQSHCGRCGTCVERREAFTEAGVPDPTRYER